MTFTPLPCRKGRITYRKRGTGELWGQDDIRIHRGADGLRVFTAHCEMRFGDEEVVRDSVLSVHPDFHPHDAFVRIMRQGNVTGTGWFRFTDTEATCESWTEAEGRISQTMPIQRPIRGFGIHAVQGDGWLGATFPYEEGPGHVQYFGRNLLHSLHHFGVTGPFITTSQSGLRYVGPETVTVPAGTFDCHRIAFVGLTNDHPDYDMWLTRDGDFLYVKGEVAGYMDSVFELAELEGGTLSEFAKGWRPLAAALIGVACGASPIPFNVLPLVLGPVAQEFGWGFAEAAAGVTIFGIIASLLAPVFGGLADRYGVRPVAIGSLAAFAVVFASFYVLPGSLGGWYFFWALLGIVGIGSTPVTWSRAVSMWFSKNRGLALGIMLLGTSLSALVVPQIAQRAIAAWGWRAAFPATALLPLLIAIPLALLWFREPLPQERPDGVSDASGNLTGLTLGETLRGYRFWVLLASILVIALAYGGAHIHMAQIVGLHGFSPAVAASVLGVVALGILAGRIIVGLLFDRFWAPGIAAPAMVLPAIACFLLMGTAPVLSQVMLGGFLLGFAAGAESDVIAFLAARYFGMANYGKIYGALYMPFGIGSAISPIIYGRVRDVTGSYDPMLAAAMLMFVTGGALLLLLGRYPDAAPALKPQVA